MADRTATTPQLIGDHLLDVREAAPYLGVGRTKFLELVNSSEAPAPVRLTPRTVRWRWSDLQAHIRKLTVSETVSTEDV